MLKFIERNKFSIIITLIVHVALFVWFNVQIVFKYPSSSERIVMIMDFTDQELPQEDEKEDAVQEETPENTETTSQTNNAINVAANAAQEKTTYTNSYNKKSIDQQVWEELKASEKAEFDKINSSKADANDKATSEKTKSDVKDINKNLVKENAEKNDNAAYGMDVVAVATYYLPNRNPQQKHIPSYKCKVPGTVRVLIKVDQKGKVQTPEIDESKTNTKNECLRSEALDYARKWVFTQDFNGPQRVSGWIEFKYISQ